MRASSIRRKGAASFEELKPACQVLVLHEDFSAYTRAVEMCRRVMERFASEMDFDIKCWNFIELADPNCARHAAKTAGAADVILLSMRTARPAVELERWLDFFFAARFKTEGVLALVLDSPNTPPQEEKRLVERLEQLAGRLGMDFISLPPDGDAALMGALPATMAPREVRE
jgi:hypothetical protein